MAGEIIAPPDDPAVLVSMDSLHTALGIIQQTVEEQQMEEVFSRVFLISPYEVAPPTPGAGTYAHGHA